MEIKKNIIFKIMALGVASSSWMLTPWAVERSDSKESGGAGGQKPEVTTSDHVSERVTVNAKAGEIYRKINELVDSAGAEDQASWFDWMETSKEKMKGSRWNPLNWGKNDQDNEGSQFRKFFEQSGVSGDSKSYKEAFSELDNEFQQVSGKNYHDAMAKWRVLLDTVVFDGVSSWTKMKGVNETQRMQQEIADDWSELASDENDESVVQGNSVTRVIEMAKYDGGHLLELYKKTLGDVVDKAKIFGLNQVRYLNLFEDLIRNYLKDKKGSIKALSDEEKQEVGRMLSEWAAAMLPQSQARTAYFVKTVLPLDKTMIGLLENADTSMANFPSFIEVDNVGQNVKRTIDKMNQKLEELRSTKLKIIVDVINRIAFIGRMVLSWDARNALIEKQRELVEKYDLREINIDKLNHVN